MPRSCTICTHPQRPEIDRALVAGQSFRSIADHFGPSETSLKRHRKDHLPAHLASARAAELEADAGSLIDQIRALQHRALSLLTKAEAEGDYRTALAGVREARACLETLLEVEGELDRRGTVNIVISPQWLQIRTVLFAALDAFPEARIAVARALTGAEEESHGNAA